jgi:uncharacterized membrane protein
MAVREFQEKTEMKDRTLKRQMTSVTVVLVALLAVAFTATPSAAAEFDGSKALLCAPGDIFECSAGADCTRSNATVANLPSFITVNFRKKVLSGTDTDGDEETTKIQNVESKDGKTMLQGAERGRAWSMVIDQETGKMSSTVADNSAAFVIFGACMVR